MELRPNRVRRQLEGEHGGLDAADLGNEQEVTYRTRYVPQHDLPSRPML